jgi:hypothetical protein
MATYISNGSGDWTTTGIWLTAADGVLTPTAAAGVAPQSGARDRIIIRRPHTVIYNTSGVFGDGGNGAVGTIATITSASIILSGGTLKASRTQNTALTAVGVIFVGGASTLTNGSFLDWGTLNDPISAFTATMAMSCANAGQAGVYIQGTTITTISNSACFCGLEKTRNTFLTLSASTGQPVITVDSCKGWVNNDLIVIESDTTSTTRVLTATITNVTGNTVTLNSNLNFARLAGTRVGNFTSTVTYRAAEGSPAPFGFNIRACPNSILQFSYMSIESVHDVWRRSDTTGSIEGLFSPIYFSNASNNLIQPVFRGISYNQPTISGTQPLYFIFTQTVPYDETVIDDCALLGNTSSLSRGLGYFGSNAIVNIKNSVCYRASNSYVTSNSYKVTLNNCYLNSENSLNFSENAGASNILNNCKIRTNVPFAYWDNIVDTKFNSCDITSLSSKAIASNTLNAFGDITLNNCTLNSSNALLSSYASDTPTLRTLVDANFNIFNPNNNNTYTTFNYFHHATTNSSIRKNGLTSLSFRPKIPNTAFVKIFTIPAIQGVAQKIKGNLRFDSAYGSTTPPSITFGGAVATTTFTCQSSVNTWNGFEYDFTPTYTGDIEIRVTGTSNASTGFVYLDGLNLDPFIKDTRWYGYQVDKNAYRTVDTLTTLTENQVSSVDITSLDRLYDASNYWTINNPLSTSYLDLYTKNGDILNFGNKNIVFNNSASTNFAYASASNTITIKTPLLSSGNNFIGLRTTGTISVSSNSNFSYIDIYGNISQPTPISLSGVYMEGTLSYSTNSNTAIEYIDCAMDTVQNLSAGFVTIKKTNSTITNGNDPEILDYVPTLLDIKNLYDGSIAIFDNNGTRQYYQNAPADNIIVLPSTATGTWRYHVARYGFAFIQENFVVDGGTKTINPDYNPDTFVTGDRVTTAAYTDLNSTQRIYNYLSYYSTTSEGIEYDPFYDKAFGSITINKNVTLNATAASVFSYNGTSLVTLKCTALNEDVLFVSSNNVTYINGTTLSDDVRVRAANLNSELLMSGVTTLTLYPSPQARDDNTDTGEILTGTIYRFLYGSTTPLGVPLVNFLYNRVNVSGTTLLNDTAIVTGRNVLQFETTGTLQQIINNQKTINIGIQKASKLIPHTTNI